MSVRSGYPNVSGRWVEEDESQVFIADNGDRYASIGCIDFGNNNFYEVIAPEKKPAELREIDPNTGEPSIFAGAINYDVPIFMMCHDDSAEDYIGEPLPDFFADLVSGSGAPHLVQVTIDLGETLHNYIN